MKSYKNFIQKVFTFTLIQFIFILCSNFFLSFNLPQTFFNGGVFNIHKNKKYVLSSTSAY